MVMNSSSSWAGGSDSGDCWFSSSPSRRYVPYVSKPPCSPKRGSADTLGMLAQRALVWPESDRLRMVDPLRRAFAHPLRLGRPLAHLLAPKVAGDLKRVAERLRRPALRLKRDMIDDLVGWLGEPRNVQALVSRAPEATRVLLTEAATNGPLVSAEGAGYGYAGVFPPEVTWALERGLLVADGWQLAEMPREIALA